MATLQTLREAAAEGDFDSELKYAGRASANRSDNEAITTQMLIDITNKLRKKIGNAAHEAN